MQSEMDYTMKNGNMLQNKQQFSANNKTSEIPSIKNGNEGTEKDKKLQTSSFPNYNNYNNQIGNGMQQPYAFPNGTPMPQYMPNIQEMPNGSYSQRPISMQNVPYGNYYNNNQNRFEKNTQQQSNAVDDGVYTGMSGLNKNYFRALDDYHNKQLSMSDSLVELNKNKMDEVWQKYNKQCKDDDDSDKKACKEYEEKLEKETEKLKKNFKNEMDYIKFSLKTLIKSFLDPFSPKDGKLSCNASDIIASNKLLLKTIEKFQEKEERIETQSTYQELREDLEQISNNQGFTSTKAIEDSLIRYQRTIGDRYSINIFLRFFYSLVDFLLGTNYHKDYVDLKNNTDDLLQEMRNFNNLSAEEHRTRISRITSLLNHHKKILANMPTSIFEPNKEKNGTTKGASSTFVSEIEKILKVTGFNADDDCVAIFKMCGADIFFAAYKSFSLEKRKTIVDILASNLEFFDIESGKEVFDTLDKKKEVVKLMLEMTEGDDKVDEILKKLKTNHNKSSEVVDKDAQRRVILKYCGGEVSSVLHDGIENKYEEKLKLQELLYHVDIINAKNDKFDTQSKRLGDLVFDAKNEFERFFQAQKTHLERLETLQDSSGATFGSIAFSQSAFGKLHQKLDAIFKDVKEAIENELGGCKPDQQDGMKAEKDAINEAIKERQGRDGKPKDGKAAEVKKLQGWDDRNLGKEGAELKKNLLKSIDAYLAEKRSEIDFSFLRSNVYPMRGTAVIDRMMQHTNVLNHDYRDIEMKKAESNKEIYDKILEQKRMGLIAQGMGNAAPLFFA